jgi:hypothetical protein
MAILAKMCLWPVERETSDISGINAEQKEKTKTLKLDFLPDSGW